MNQWTVTTHDVGKRIDVFISEKLNLSRSKASEMIKDGIVFGNDTCLKSKYKVKLNDIIKAEDYHVKASTLEGVAMALDIVFEDRDILVLNKQRGLVVHPGKGVHEPTLLHGLVHYLNQSDEVVKPGMVHRIDRDTSGLLVIAKNDKAHTFLADQLVDKTMARTYLALVHGVIEDAMITIEAPIGMDPLNTKKMSVTEKNSKYAKTDFIVKQRFDMMTLVECHLYTGRTHQIRVHAAYSGHPLLGDPLYGIDDDKSSGHYLVAYQLQFIHPRTHQRVSYQVDIPEYFEQAYPLK